MTIHKTKVKISERGQVVVPAKIRKKLGIEQGIELIIYIEGNDIILRPVMNERSDFLSKLNGLDKKSTKKKVDVVEELKKQR